MGSPAEDPAEEDDDDEDGGVEAADMRGTRRSQVNDVTPRTENTPVPLSHSLLLHRRAWMRFPPLFPAQFGIYPHPR